MPSFLSNRSLVEVHLEVDTNLTSQQKDELELHMELPLHARYQVHHINDSQNYVGVSKIRSRHSVYFTPPEIEVDNCTRKDALSM